MPFRTLAVKDSRVFSEPCRVTCCRQTGFERVGERGVHLTHFSVLFCFREIWGVKSIWKNAGDKVSWEVFCGLETNQTLKVTCAI